jgi:tetratricopeptide (TPR) repeat protein
MSSSAGNGPPVYRFSQVLRRLSDVGDSRGVVRLVERWAEHGNLNQAARLAEARAFIDLRLMDRAWVRLREAAEAEPESIEVQLLMAEMFIERGWPGRARKNLKRVSAAEFDEFEAHWMERLKVGASESPKGPPDNAQDIEVSGTADNILFLAEQYLAAGSLVRAESLLERLIRDGFSPPRVSDLLWGIRGSFTSAGKSSDELLNELSGDERVAEWSSIELTDSAIPLDETAHVSPEDLPEPLNDQEEMRGFPTLFRREDEPVDCTDMGEEEVTVSSMRASAELLGEVGGGGHTDPDLTPGPGRGDTRIMEFITHGDGTSLQSSQGVIHKSVPSSVPSTLDLRVHQETYLPPEDETFLEDEDQDLIIMTRREGEGAGRRSSRDSRVESLRGPSKAKSVSLVRRPSRKTKTRSGMEERVAREIAQQTASEKFGSLGPEPDTDDMVAGVRRIPRQFSRMVGYAAVVGAVTLLCAWLVVYVLHWIASGQIVQESHEVIVSGDYQSLKELEAKLAGQVEAEREPTEVRALELALIRTILWSQYTGDASRMEAAQDGFATAQINDMPKEELAVVNGFLRLAMGDIEAVPEAIEQLDMNDSVHRVLAARYALFLGKERTSRELLERMGPEEPDMPLMEMLARESLYTALDDQPEAINLRRQLIDLHPDNPFVQISRFHEEWDEQGVEERLLELADVMESLPGPVAPRQEGRLHAQRAMLLTEKGDHELAKESWLAALVVDPAHPQFLYAAAGQKLEDNQLLSGLDDLNRCLGARPWDFACRRGTIQVLIELDRLNTARQMVDAWADRKTRVLDAWVSWAEGKPEDAFVSLEGNASALGVWVRGMAQVGVEPEKSRENLERVSEAWSDVSQPMDRALGMRASAQVMLATLPVQDAAERAVMLSPNDPVVHVMVARVLEAEGQRASALTMYEEATSLGPEHALTHHALGLYWFDPQGNMDDARRSWQRYLELQPNGDRARKTRARMGRR